MSSWRWLTSEHPNVGDAPDEVIDAVAKTVSVGATFAGPWLTVNSANKLQTKWLEATAAHRTSSARHERAYRRAFFERALFLYNHGSASDLCDLLDDPSFALWSAEENVARRGSLHVMRADARRMLGDFNGAMGEMELARDAATENTEGMLEDIALKIEIDLGRLDRARIHLGQLANRATAAKPYSAPHRRFVLANFKWLAATGNFKAAAALAENTLQELKEIEPKTVPLERFKAQVQMSEAIARSKSAKSNADFERALAALSVSLDDQLLDPGSRLPLRLERAECLVRGGGSANLKSAYEELRHALEDQETMVGHSVIFDARCLAQLHALARRLDLPEEQRTSAALLEKAFDCLVNSWESLDTLDGGVGFLEFDARRAVLSEVLESRSTSEAKTAGTAPSDPTHALSALLRVDACSTIARALAERAESGAPTPTAQSVIDLSLAENVTVVYFVPTESVTHRFTVTEGRVLHDRLEGSGEFGPRLAQLAKWVRTRPAGSVTPPSSERPSASPSLESYPDAKSLDWLSTRIFPEVGNGDSTAYWIAGLDAFGSAPIEALPLPPPASLDRMRGYAALRRPVTRIPSIHAMLQLRELKRPNLGDRPKTLKIFSLAGRLDGQPEIGLSGEELRFFRTLPNVRANSVDGPMSTRAGFASMLRGTCELFVAWTHGNLDRTATRPAELLVRPAPGADDPTKADRIDAAFIEATLDEAPLGRTPLVAFIASCKAARGQRRLGDGAASHLGGAFFSRGVSAIILSPENLDRDATFLFLQSFTRAFLSEGLTVDQAVLRARKTVAATPGFEHPHFWALPQLVGWGGAQAK